MRQAAGLAGVFSRVLDRLAALCIFLIMLIVVLNVLLRVLLHNPLVGTMDYVNILTALTIGLGLAFCAFNGGHIAVEFIFEKLPAGMGNLADVLLKLAALLLWGASAWYMAAYAQTMKQTGLVASTTQFPMYPVVYLISFGLLALCLVLLVQFIDAVRKVIK
jgi:TRAP-type C4-dicarboxylate transport system permease small subunit